MKKKSTSHDDVYRTMMNNCIPLVNEVFGKHYTGSEKIVFHPNEHFINQQDGNEQKRITDSYFFIISSDGIEEKFIKVNAYSLQQLSDKNLFFLLPFCIFNLEDDFPKYNKE